MSQRCNRCKEKVVIGKNHVCDPKGTPTTLFEAIENGITSAPAPYPEPLALSVERHVVDYLAQKFGAHELRFRGQETEALWKAITGREYGK